MATMKTRFAIFVVLVTIGGSFLTHFDGLVFRTFLSKNRFTLTLVQ